MRLLTLLACLLFAATATAAPPFHVGGRGDPVLLVVGPEADHELYVRDGGRDLAGFLAHRGWSVWITHADDLGPSVDVLAYSFPQDEVALVGHGLGGTACLHLLAEAMTAADIPDPILERAREAGSVGRHPAMDDVQAWLAIPWPAQPQAVPLLVTCAETDRMAPCEEAWRARDRLGSTDKTWRVFGLDLGDHADYGHVDLCNGDHAAEDVYPFITEWLADRIDGR